MARKVQQKVANKSLGVAYIRVSTEDQNLGPDAQREQIARWAAANNVQIVAEYVDHGVSGAAPVDERPGLLQALSSLTEHGAGYFLVAKRDRLARDIMIAAMVDRLVERDGAQVVAADGAGNGSSPEAALLRGVIDLFAQYERAMIRARTKAALAVKKSRNEFTGGAVPFGYDVVEGKLVVNEAQHTIIAEMRRRRANGESLRTIASWLTEEGHLPASGRWHAETVKTVIERD
jgi:DNA invertase Pin-like site-specific DNA recombinase